MGKHLKDMGTSDGVLFMQIHANNIKLPCLYMYNRKKKSQRENYLYSDYIILYKWMVIHVYQSSIYWISFLEQVSLLCFINIHYYKVTSQLRENFCCLFYPHPLWQM